MKFTIFSWWENCLKRILYVVTFALTGCLFKFYFRITDENGSFAFIITIVYALLLFLIQIPINYVDRYTAAKIYERERYFLTLKRLREATNSTIKKFSIDNPKESMDKIVWFQLLTGRDDKSSERRIRGERTPVGIREMGFIYTEAMKELETKYINACEANDKKALLHVGKKLKKCYDKSSKGLEKNYSRLMKTYGGALQDLVERDYLASDIDYSLNDVKSKADDIVSEISFLKDEISEAMDSCIEVQREWSELCKMIEERLEGIETSMLDLSDKA